MNSFNSIQRITLQSQLVNYWQKVGGGTGGFTTNSVASLAFDNSGNLYAGGTFTLANNTAGGTTTCNLIAKIEFGTVDWVKVGGGTGGFSGVTSVQVVASDASGNLYAGGAFTSANNTAGTTTPCNRIAILASGAANWAQIGANSGGGFTGLVRTIVFDASRNVYAGGEFTTGNSFATVCNYVAKFAVGATFWEQVGGGNGGFNNIVRSLAFDPSGNLYAGGSFTLANTTSGTTPCNRIAKFASNGTNWVKVGGGTGGFNNIVNSLVVDASGNLYAGGSFTLANNTAGGTTPCNYVAKLVFGETDWTQVGGGTGGFNGIVNSLAVDPSGNLYACGTFTSANITGGGTIQCNNVAKISVGATDWTQVGFGSGGGFTSGSINALAVNGSRKLFLGGSFTGANDTTGTTTCNRVAKYLR